MEYGYFFEKRGFFQWFDVANSFGCYSSWHDVKCRASRSMKYGNVKNSACFYGYDVPNPFGWYYARCKFMRNI